MLGFHSIFSCSCSANPSRSTAYDVMFEKKRCGQMHSFEKCCIDTFEDLILDFWYEVEIENHYALIYIIWTQEVRWDVSEWFVVQAIMGMLFLLMTIWVCYCITWLQKSIFFTIFHPSSCHRRIVSIRLSLFYMIHVMSVCVWPFLLSEQYVIGHAVKLYWRCRC